MASVATRDSIAHYERLNNALLQAIRPDGILYDTKERGPFEALLVPREIALRVYALSPYLKLGTNGDGLRCGAATPPPPYNESEDAALWGGSIQPSDGTKDLADSCSTDPGNAELKERLRNVTSAELQRIRQVLENFLKYHLIHFDNSGNCRFTTAHGDRGEFSETLDSVKRFGRLGNPSVVADIEPLATKDGKSAPATPAGHVNRSSADWTPQVWVPPRGLSALPPYHPATLQAYLIDSILMDPQELQQMLHQLDRIVNFNRSAVGSSSTTTTPTAKQSHTAKTDGVSSPQATPSGKSIPTPPLAGHVSTRFNGLSIDIANFAAGEDDDIVVEEDLTPYVTKSNRRERAQQQQQQQQQQHEHSFLYTRPAAATATADAAVASSAAVPSAPLPPVTAPAVSASGTSSLTIPVGTALASPSPAQRHQHANLLNHQYSKESIKDYRRVVAADNDIQYAEFERLMETKACFPLVKLVSDFVTAAQMRGKGFKDNRSFSILISALQEEMDRIPTVRDNEKRRTVLNEGVEKYVTTKLYFLFFNVDEHDRLMNNLLQDKLRRAERLTASQLDALAEVEKHHVWGQAMFELDGMNFFKSPREKLRCGMRASELLSLAVGDILAARQRAKAQSSARAAGAPPTYTEAAGDGEGTHTTYATTANDRDHLPPLPHGTDKADKAAKATAANAASHRPVVAFGADEFLPCFMLLVLRAQPYNYYQNIQYIDRFRAEHLRSLEESYCLANMISAVDFWLNCSDDGRLTGEVTRQTAQGMPTVSASPAAAAGTSAHAPTNNPHPQAKETAKVITAKKSSLGTLAPTGTVSRGTLVSVPVMREEDLLPSVRQASSVRMRPRAVEPMVAQASEEPHGPNLMDKLFDWVGNPATAPRRPEGAPPPPSLPPPATTTAATAATTGTTTAPSSDGQSANGAVKATIYELLVRQNKPFEQLSQAELRGIVEEARLLAHSQAK